MSLWALSLAVADSRLKLSGWTRCDNCGNDGAGFTGGDHSHESWRVASGLA